MWKLRQRADGMWCLNRGTVRLEGALSWHMAAKGLAQAKCEARNRAKRMQEVKDEMHLQLSRLMGWHASNEEQEEVIQ